MRKLILFLLSVFLICPSIPYALNSLDWSTIDGQIQKVQHQYEKECVEIKDLPDWYKNYPKLGDRLIASTVIGNWYAGGDTTPPTLTSVTIDMYGYAYTFVYSEPVTADTTGELCSDCSVTMSVAGEETLSYYSGDGTNTIICIGDITVNTGETVSDGLDYTPGTIVDLADNALEAIDSKAVTNNSEMVGGCEVCEDGLVFSMFFNSGTTVFEGRPGGCSAGDTVGTLSANASIVNGYLLADGETQEYIEFDLADVWTNTEGSLAFKIAHDDYGQHTQFFKVIVDADNNTYIGMPTSNDLIFIYEVVGNPRQAACVSGKFTESNDYYLVARWEDDNSPDYDYNLELSIYDSTGTLLQTCHTDCNNLTAWSPQATTFIIGNRTNVGGDFKIYWYKMWDTWGGAPSGTDLLVLDDIYIP